MDLKKKKSEIEKNNSKITPEKWRNFDYSTLRKLTFGVSKKNFENGIF
jgi:hypothetical protein